MIKKRKYNYIRKRLESTVMIIILTISAITALFPFYWMIVSSFKTNSEMAKYPPSLIPSDFTLNNYITIFSNTNLKLYILNSFIVSFTEAALMLAVTLPAAYGFYRLKLKHKESWLYFLLIINSLPIEVIMVYNYKMMIQLDLNNTLIALVLPFLFKFHYIYLIYNAFEIIPSSIYYAACLDRASEFKFMVRIALPQALPTIAFVTVLSIISSWNAFLWPMMITNSYLTRTLPLGVYTYITEIGSKNELVLAMATVSEIPVIIVFLFSRKLFIKGHKFV